MKRDHGAGWRQADQAQGGLGRVWPPTQVGWASLLRSPPYGLVIALWARTSAAEQERFVLLRRPSHSLSLAHAHVRNVCEQRSCPKGGGQDARSKRE